MNEDKDFCVWCGREIKVQIFKGLEYCSEEHRKLLVRSLGDESQVD